MTNRLTDEQRTWFLEHLVETGCDLEAARRTGISLDDADDERAADRGFAAACIEAGAAANEALEAEARRRAMEVIDRPVIYRGQPVLREDGTTLTVRRYNDRMMIQVLRLIEAGR